MSLSSVVSSTLAPYSGFVPGGASHLIGARGEDASTPPPKTDTPAIDAARQALATANALVDQDKRNHSPSCVAVDQKLVDKAQIALSQATASAGSTLDIAI